jgi:hypothetical protein
MASSIQIPPASGGSSTVSTSAPLTGDGSIGSPVTAASTTGSGAIVLATSPTLTTPNLGTPSAAVLTNATGTAAGLTAGAASAIAVGGITGFGTGVATFLVTPSSANFASALTDETGSGAVVFGTSPALVTPTLGVAAATSVTLAAGAAATPSLTWSGAGSGFYQRGGSTISFSVGSNVQMDFRSSGILLFSGVGSDLTFASDPGSSIDLRVVRDGANVLGSRNGTNAQAFRLYNTFTTLGTSVEYLKFDWITTSNQARIGTVMGTSSGTARVLSIDYGGLLASPTAAITVPITSGNIVFGGGITTPGGATFHTTSTALTDGSGASAGTIGNAPSIGNPTKWIGINDNGTTRYIPAW